MSEIKYEILKEIFSVKSENRTMIKLNYMSWNGGEPKYDLRKWSSDNRPYKGITLTEEELSKVVDGLSITNLGEKEIEENDLEETKGLNPQEMLDKINE